MMLLDSITAVITVPANTYYPSHVGVVIMIAVLGV